MLTESCQKVAPRFCCNFCDYFTDKKSSYNKHLTTSKHIKLTEVNTFGNKSCSKVAIDHNEFTCEGCNKYFKSRVGLWKHNKTCIKEDIEINNTSDKDIIMLLIKQNKELIDMVKNGINNTINNTTTNTNSHNKAFNLNFFLNETCKNAMNINDFVDSIKLQLNDLISIGELGYVEGISNIIVKKLNDLDETQRPIHCTDKKRETVYIKDEDKWEKDDEEKKKLRKVIGKVAFKNQKLFPQFKEKYPDYNDAKSKYSDQYSKIVIESFEDSNKEKQDKVIKKITKEVLIEK
jgi:hypothetical protein